MATGGVAMILALLYLLATADGAFCGYRAAAGRSAFIDKRLYYRRALLRGAVRVQLAIVLAAIVLVFELAQGPAVLMADMKAAALRMLWVYVPYALVGLVAFAVRLLPSVDFRSLTSVMVF